MQYLSDIRKHIIIINPYQWLIGGRGHRAWNCHTHFSPKNFFSGWNPDEEISLSEYSKFLIVNNFVYIFWNIS